MKRMWLIGMILLLGLLGPQESAGQQRQLPATGETHVFTILVEFRNVRFSVEDPQAHFSELLNGRVQQYFQDNSQGLFTPYFDVCGPVLLDEPMARYGQDVYQSGERIGDVAPEKALVEACLQVNDSIDFSPYDGDGDGFVDMVLFYFAGYDQAAGGLADAIWSHHQDVQRLSPEVADVTLDGVKLGYYFCSSELKGSEGTVPMGIGTTVHEMGHALGLPDLYDTNSGKDGMAGGVYAFSPMCRGLYNDQGDTPPYLTALERMMLGWMDPEAMRPLQEGWMQLAPVQELSVAYSPTSTEGEYFLYECRNGEGWDAPLPPGLVVYHVDQSARELGGVPIHTLWEDWRLYNNLNAWGHHPCYYLVPPMAPDDFDYAPAVNPATLVFPGAGQVHACLPTDWEGVCGDWQLSCIDFREGKIRFRVMEQEENLLSGLVQDAGGAPLWGVKVQLLQEDGTPLAADRSGMDGFYRIQAGADVSGSLQLSASLSGYRPVTVPVDLQPGEPLCTYLTLFKEELPASTELCLYDPSLSSGYFPESEPLIGAVRFTPQDLAPYTGGRLEKVTIYPHITQAEEAGPLYVTVDLGGKRVLNQPVEDAVLGEYYPLTVDVSEAQVLLPDGLDLYVGYGFEQQGSNYPLSAVYPGSQGNSYYIPFSLEAQPWQPLYLEKAGFYMDIMLSIGVEEVVADDWLTLGYVTMQVPRGPFEAGETIALELAVPEGVALRKTQWSLDGADIPEGELRLSSGEHLLGVTLFYEDGREEYLEKRLEVY